MKKFLTAIVFGLMAIAAQAEASFDQIEGLIQQKNYAAAASGLEGIIQNHPKSAKAFYAMAQAQAGLGNLEKAQKALNIATGLNPTLDFAPASSVQSLKDAITPQTAKIEAVETSHALRNFMLFVMFAGFAVACYFLYSVYARKQDEEQAERDSKFLREEQERQAKRKQEHMDMLAKQDAERKAELAAEAALKAHKNYGHERFDPANPDKLKSVKQFKEEKAAQELREAKLRAELAEAKANEEAALARGRESYARMNSTPAPTQTVVHTNSNDGLLTGMIIGNMMSGSHHDNHSHDTTIIRETVREVPAPSRDSSWDDAPSRSSSRSSSWDDDSSSSRSSSSSSWSDSSGSSSSSWDSGSSSSDSSSSSSWD